MIREAFPGYQKPSIAIDTVLIRVDDYVEASNRTVSDKAMQLLLVRKKESKQWHLPGTILRLGETPKDAINRIIVNKTGNYGIHYEQLYTVADDLNRDERGHIISIVYIGLINNDTDVVLPDTSEYESKWFWIGKQDIDGDRNLICDEVIHSSELKYDHSKILNDTIDRIKGKLMYTDIGFNFIGKEFTIKELENTFVAINERNIPGFRRIISNKVVGTGKMSDGKAFRPAEQIGRAHV